jgi:hypothetical protein
MRSLVIAVKEEALQTSADYAEYCDFFIDAHKSAI